MKPRKTSKASGKLFGAAAAPADVITAHVDGGARGNPGPAGYGVVFTAAGGKKIGELSQFLGVRTNNYAEYSGLIAALEWALQNGHAAVRVVSDSELMVRQMNGEYKVKSPDLKILHQRARELARLLHWFEISHTLRGGNRDADRLANAAMDDGMGRSAR
jgi:ribonuclease HI